MDHLKKALLEHLANDVYCRLGVSKTHGVGVFALRAIPAGTCPLKNMSPTDEIKFSKKEIEGLPKSVRKQMERFCYFTEKSVFVPSKGLNCMDLAICLNHSKKPNLMFEKTGELRAIKTIKKGQELTIDYDLSFGGEHRF
jgi:SET domain-containing protein